MTVKQFRADRRDLNCLHNGVQDALPPIVLAQRSVVTERTLTRRVRIFEAFGSLWGVLGCQLLRGDQF